MVEELSNKCKIAMRPNNFTSMNKLKYKYTKQNYSKYFKIVTILMFIGQLIKKPFLISINVFYL